MSGSGRLEHEAKRRDIAEKTGNGGAQRLWNRAYDLLSAMQQRGPMQPTDAPYLETLRAKAGGSAQTNRRRNRDRNREQRHRPRS